MDEFERIEEIRRRLETSAESHDVELGIGDDAAVLRSSNARQVLSVDSAIDSVHFQRSFGSPHRLGRRAVMAAASDLAAMGARPRCALTALTLPTSLDDATLFAFVDGIAAAGRELGMPVVGGNLASGAQLGITTTVVGELSHEALTRSGAHAGDALFVTGSLGCAALGLRWLLREPAHDDSANSQAAHGDSARKHTPHIEAARFEAYVNAWLDPTAEIAAGLALVGHATACIDISDGFAQDLGHLLASSGVGARVQVDALPTPKDFNERARELSQSGRGLALAGGEDYTLLFCAPADDAVALTVGTRVGVCTERLGLELRDGDDKPVSVPPGYQHG